MSIQTISTPDPASLIQGLQWPVDDLSPEAASWLLRIMFSPEDQIRMQDLAEKARAGSLTLTEKDEILRFDLVGHFLGMVHSKARRALKRGSK